MCGIAGIISPDPADMALLPVMTDAMTRRGPDARGIWQGNGVGLGHRRLSIIDLSPRGNQPMFNEDGSLILSANGEIYNFPVLTQDLKSKGHTFCSDSDCEPLLHLYEEYGDSLLKEVNGMFAFALWDNRQHRLLAAVDRFGKKPLYYAVQDQRLILASQLHALLHFPWISRQV
ncbi:MAG: asparagine synthetase B, partial [Magnetococcales bacterium]|nr:asparagine synthetase B [Magnetococcales bacterium]